MSLLGIDVGTTGCKAAAFSEGGECLASAYQEYPTLQPREGWAELDSRQVLAAVRRVIAEVASGTTADPVTALCVSSMGEAMTPVSRAGEVLGNSILSFDTRGAEYADELAAQLSPERFYAINPNILGPNYSYPKLRWLREHQPELYDRTDKFLLWGDMVIFMLCGRTVTSHSHANRTLLFDIRAEDWSDTLLALTGIEREKLPRPLPGGAVAGTVDDVVADELGLPRGVHIVVGGHDQCCNALGAGIDRAGKAVCGIGTYECITPAFDHIPPAAAMLAQGLNVEHHVLPGLYVTFIYNHAGSLVRWFRDTFAAADRRLLREDEDIYDVLAREMPAEPTALFVLPYFETTGPPEFVHDAAGAILGLKTSTTRGDILKAIMECVTLYFVDNVTALGEMGIRVGEFIATGGGAKSDPWLQMKADIFGVPFARPRITEGGILGAAMLAGMATGVYRSADEAVGHFVERVRTFEPDPARHRRYREKLAVYRTLFPLLRPVLTRRTSTREA